MKNSPSVAKDKGAGSGFICRAFPAKIASDFSTGKTNSGRVRDEALSFYQLLKGDFYGGNR